MIPWTTIVYVGNPSVMLPAAAAIAAWLMAGRFWKMAALWSLLFCAGLSLVVASKMYFIGWGIGLHALDFKALSGHAMLATAVVPVMIFLLLQRHTPAVRVIGTILGLLFSITVSIFLVAFGFHSMSEAVGGFAIGGIVSLGFVRISERLPTLCSNHWQLPWGLFVFLAVLYAEPASIEQRMTDLALHLSGRSSPYSFMTR